MTKRLPDIGGQDGRGEDTGCRGYRKAAWREDSVIINKDVIIIGAGAAGLFCAIECGKRGRAVLVIDHAERIGSKVRISGGGRSNFTNLHATPEHYLSHNPHFCKSALARFTPRDILSLAGKHRIAYYEKEAGQIFCVRSSRDLIMMLEKECAQADVETRLACRVSEVRKGEDFIVETQQGTFCSDSLVIATGGLSYKMLGASGFGHEIARNFGLKVTKLSPALVPFIFAKREKGIFGALAGVSVDAVVSCGKKRFRGNILFTHQGLSGPAALQASLYWEPGMTLKIDLLPSADFFDIFLSKRAGKMEMRTLLAVYLPKRVAQTWCDHIVGSKPINQYAEKELRGLAGRLHAWEVVPQGTESYEIAEVTAGGVDTDAISSKTMEAKDVPGLYFIGEVLDVTGELGGYNLHWAWASGYAAGQYA